MKSSKNETKSLGKSADMKKGKIPEDDYVMDPSPETVYMIKIFFKKSWSC